MSHNYSLDFRQKVITAISNNYSYREIANIFNIDKTTVYRWYKRYKENKLEPIITREYHSNKIDKNKLKEYVDANSSLTLNEIGKYFNVSHYTIWYHLKKLGYVIKKN